nr:helix-turn-helix domain-containing protein [uncultured Brevundimonas sp.]
MIPDMPGLIRSVVVWRSLVPIRLAAGDLKLMRRALNMNQREFAEAMEIDNATVSRWESAVGQGVGGWADKTIRHNMCALLKADHPELEYDPAEIARMRFVPMEMPMMVVERVLIRGIRERVWEPIPQAA